MPVNQDGDGFPMQGTRQSSKVSITGADQWTDELKNLRGDFNVGVDNLSSFNMTVTLQRKHEGDTAWRDVTSYTAATETVGNEPEWKTTYRLGVKTGDWTAGSCDVRLGQ